MYIEKGAYDWWRTAATVTAIYRSAGGKKQMDPRKLNPFIEQTASPAAKPRMSLLELANALPGIKIVDKRKT